MTPENDRIEFELHNFEVTHDPFAEAVQATRLPKT